MDDGEDALWTGCESIGFVDKSTKSGGTSSTHNENGIEFGVSVDGGKRGEEPDNGTASDSGGTTSDKDGIVRDGTFSVLVWASFTGEFIRRVGECGGLD